MQIRSIGIDLGKTTFHLVGLGERGKSVIRKKLSRKQLPVFERLLRNVTGELELLNRLKQEFDHHPLDLAPERCYSPATLAKSYFSEMGIKPPGRNFNIPDRINGIAMQAFVAGRAECR